MADSYQGFQGTSPSAIGTTANTGEGIITLSTMVITIPVGSDTIKLDYGSNVPTTVNINAMPVINSLTYRTTDVFYNGSNLTTIDGNLDVNGNLGVASNADINGTLNVDGNITMPASGQYIELNPANNTGWGNTFLNTNIYHGFKKGGGGFNLTAPEFVSYPTTFSIGGLLYPATLINMNAGSITLNGLANTNILGASLSIESLATAIAGTLTVAGVATFTGATFHSGANSFSGVNTLGGATTITGITNITGALNATGATNTLSAGANTLTAGANTITAVGTNTITGAINLLTGGVNTYTALQHYFVGDLVDFTNYIGSTCKLKVDTIESGIGMELINVSSINGQKYPPPGSGATVSTFNQLYTSSFKANTAQISSISSQQLFVSSINGSAYPPVATQTISSFNTASISSLNVSSINNAVYPPPNTTPALWANYPASSNVLVPGTYVLQTDKISAYTLPSPGQIQMLSPIIMGNNSVFTKSIDSTYSAGINLGINSQFTNFTYTVAGFSRPPTINLNNGFITNCSSITGISSINGAVYPPPSGNVSAWATFPATSSINALANGGIQTSFIDATNAPGSPFNVMGINNGSVRFQNIRNGTPGTAPTIEFSDGSLNLMRTIAMTSYGAITNVSSINGASYPAPSPPLWRSYKYDFTPPGISVGGNVNIFNQTIFNALIPSPVSYAYQVSFYDGVGGGGTIMLLNCIADGGALIMSALGYTPTTPVQVEAGNIGQYVYLNYGVGYTLTQPTYAIYTPINYSP